MKKKTTRYQKNYEEFCQRIILKKVGAKEEFCRGKQGKRRNMKKKTARYQKNSEEDKVPNKNSEVDKKKEPDEIYRR